MKTSLEHLPALHRRELELVTEILFEELEAALSGGTSEKKRRGRVYLPGFAFRMLFLGSVFLIPTLASVLLYPVALVAMIPTRSRGKQQILIGVLALAPLVSFILWLALAQYQGHIVLASHALAPGLLILLTIMSFWEWRIHSPDQNDRQSAQV